MYSCSVIASTQEEVHKYKRAFLVLLLLLLIFRAAELTRVSFSQQQQLSPPQQHDGVSMKGFFGSLGDSISNLFSSENKISKKGPIDIEDPKSIFPDNESMQKLAELVLRDKADELEKALKSTPASVNQAGKGDVSLLLLAVLAHKADLRIFWFSGGKASENRSLRSGAFAMSLQFFLNNRTR